MAYSSKQGKRPMCDASKPSVNAPGKKKKRVAPRNQKWNADLDTLLLGNDFVVPQIVLAVMKTEKFSLIAVCRAVSLEFKKEIDRLVPDLVASLNEDLASRKCMRGFWGKWRHWLDQVPVELGGGRDAVTDTTRLADKALLKQHFDVKPVYTFLPHRQPDISALPDGVTVATVVQLVARCKATLQEGDERLSHSVGEAQAASLNKFLMNGAQLSVTLKAGVEMTSATHHLHFGKHTLFAMARSSCEVCCLVGKGHSNPGHGGCSFELLPNTRQIVYSRSACICYNSALVKRWTWSAYNAMSETNMRCDLERNTLVANDPRVQFFGNETGVGVGNKEMAHVRRQLEMRALMRAMLRVSYSPKREITLAHHDLTSLVGGTNNYGLIFGETTPQDDFFVWLKKHPCVPEEYSLQSKLELTDAQMQRATRSVNRQEDEIKASAKVLTTNEFSRYKQDFLDTLHLDSLMQHHTLETVEEELPGTLAMLKLLARGKTGFEDVNCIPGVADLSTVVIIMLTVGVLYDSAYTGLRASPWAYSYISGISAGWIVPKARVDCDDRLAYHMALDVLSTNARWKEVSNRVKWQHVSNQERIMAEWNTRVLAMHAFDALEWNSIVVKENSCKKDFVDVLHGQSRVQTFICGMSVADVHVRTMYSHIYCASGIHAAASELMQRMGYDTVALPDVEKPAHVFLEGVARLLAFGLETRAGALCLLSTTPLCNTLYMEDLVDAGLKNETLGPVADYMRNKQGEA